MACLLAAVVAFARKREAFASFWLVPATVGLFAAWHHSWRDLYPADDIGFVAEAVPRLVRVRGILADEPKAANAAPSPLRSLPARERATCTLHAEALEAGAGWQRASGLARLTFPIGDGLRAGDGVEVVGWLATPSTPANPGESDRSAILRDRRIRAELDAGLPAITRPANPSGPEQWLPAVRGWGEATLRRHLAGPEGGLAVALLLGEEAGLSNDDWQRYVRTGVVHALAVSGQHLAVLAAFAWFCLRLVGVRRWQGAVVVAVLLALYAALTGGRPPVLRAAVAVGAACGAVVFRRPAVPANLFALAWLAVLAARPTDAFTPGCQLSFLAVAVLGWAVGDWLRPPEPDRLDRLIAESRPAWQRRSLLLGSWLAKAWAANAVIGMAVAPVVWAWYGMLSPAALLIGPPVVALVSVALVAGFLLLAADAVFGGWAALPFAILTHGSLAGCDGLVRWADTVPGASVHLGPLPAAWALTFGVGLLAIVFVPPPARWRLGFWAGGAWLAVALWLGLPHAPAGDELRVTFLSVGHGGCAVLELPDGGVMLYDAGSTTGPGVAVRVVAPFLWHRGIGRIDGLYLSHADLDHFNGVPALSERFRIGEVTTTATFAQKESPGVGVILADLTRRGVPVRVASAGEVVAVAGVTIEVLHPPTGGVPGNENARSLVLRVRHRGHTLLLTGDLEGAGLARVLALPTEPVDVLMAPHHGSASSNGEPLARWASPALVVSSQGPGDTPPTAGYARRGSTVWTTAEHGAITVRSGPTGLTAETFRSGLRVGLRPPG